MTATSAVLAPPAYDALAPAYDLLTQDYGHDRWVRGLLGLASAHGLEGRRALDVACGTGSSFLPLLDEGFDVTACDVSPGMAARAVERAEGRARVHVADMRALPVWGAFDLITCLDDAINHLAEPDDVVAALASMRANLAPRGLLVFDVNTLAAYRRPADRVTADDDHLVAWQGGAAALSDPGGSCEVALDIFTYLGADVWRRSSFRQPHRHYPLTELAGLVERAGLRIAALVGQSPGARLEPEADEALHPKAVVVAAHPRPDALEPAKEARMIWNP